MNLEGKRVVVAGLGASGFAAARALVGAGANVVVTDGESTPAIEERAAVLRGAGVEVHTGGHDPALLPADLAVVSPGIPPHAPIAQMLAGAGVPAIGEIELAFRLARCDLLAVTGTNGKTTTTSLLAAMLSEAGIPALAAGNIGTPLVEAIYEVPDQGVVAVEVSSFQLASIAEFRPRVAVVLNVAEDHTDWHGAFDDYARAKARICENQGPDDVVVFNRDDPVCVAIASEARSRRVPFSAAGPVDDGIGVSGGALVWRGRVVIPVDAVTLPGRVGIEDTAAAAAAALEYGIDARAVARAIKGHHPLAHRCEVVAEIDGVTYVDDSKATNPHATTNAVRGWRDVVLIAGGRSKGIDLSALRATVPPVIAVVAMGESANEVEEVFSGLVPVERAGTMTEAVALARKHSIAGGSVFLSPGCASLDMYPSYAARGEDFARAVGDVVGSNEEGVG